MIYGDNAKRHFDEAVRWVILLLIFVFDPLAVLLLIAASQSLREIRKVKIDNENIANFTEVDNNDIEAFKRRRKSKPERYQVCTEKTQSEDQTYENETKEVKDIVTQDEEQLWEKFKSRREWKEDNSGITKHEYIDEEKRQRS